jgi:SAM-dependent methyltransferase
VFADNVLTFVRGALPRPPARVLEVGAGSGELAAELANIGYDVVAIDPASDTPAVQPIPLIDLKDPAHSFDAAVAVVSLHHVEPLEASCVRLAELVKPGGTLVVDEFDVEAFDERAARWWLAHRDSPHDHDHDHDHEPRTPAEVVDFLRHHIHRLTAVREALTNAGFSLDEAVRGPYLHRWDMPPGLQPEETRLIASGELRATGARFSARAASASGSALPGASRRSRSA